MADRVVKDRRSKPRVETNLGAQITSTDGGFGASVKNMSVSGVLLEVDREIPEMTMLGMSLSLPALPEKGQTTSYTFELTGAVVRCQKGEVEGQYEVAVFMTDLPRETRTALQEFIEERLS